nr:hypothetical protein Iba_chr10dCG3530 [Ipomoea batatas]
MVVGENLGEQSELFNPERSRGGERVEREIDGGAAMVLPAFAVLLGFCCLLCFAFRALPFCVLLILDLADSLLLLCWAFLSCVALCFSGFASCCRCSLACLSPSRFLAIALLGAFAFPPYFSLQFALACFSQFSVVLRLSVAVVCFYLFFLLALPRCRLLLLIAFPARVSFASLLLLGAFLLFPHFSCFTLLPSLVFVLSFSLPSQISFSPYWVKPLRRFSFSPFNLLLPFVCLDSTAPHAFRARRFVPSVASICCNCPHGGLLPRALRRSGCGRHVAASVRPRCAAAVYPPLLSLRACRSAKE